MTHAFPIEASTELLLFAEMCGNVLKSSKLGTLTSPSATYTIEYLNPDQGDIENYFTYARVNAETGIMQFNQSSIQKCNEDMIYYLVIWCFVMFKMGGNDVELADLNTISICMAQSRWSKALLTDQIIEMFIESPSESNVERLKNIQKYLLEVAKNQNQQ